MSLLRLAEHQWLFYIWKGVRGSSAQRRAPKALLNREEHQRLFYTVRGGVLVIEHLEMGFYV